MRSNPIQFAVVREDPAVELALFARAHERVLLVASGGCTALTLQAAWPETRFTQVDPNPAQLELVQLARGLDPATLRAFNVGCADPAGLSQCGNFESLFRGLRRFIEELVAGADEHMLCTPAGDALDTGLADLGMAAGAGATVVHSGMGAVDWSFVLTSEI